MEDNKGCVAIIFLLLLVIATILVVMATNTFVFGGIN